MAVAVACHAALLAAYAIRFSDLAALVCVGRAAVGHVPYEVVRIGFKRGYDGQFYYAIARAPWGRHQFGIDSVPVRQVRILYPLLGWAASGGDARRLFWAMPLVNLLAIAGLTWLGARLALAHDLSPWWGVLLPLAVNTGMPALRNLTDPLSTCAVAGLLVAWLLRRPWWALALWAAAAVFAREQNVVVVLVVVAAAAWRQQGKTCAGLAVVLGLWAGWVGALQVMYGQWPFLPTAGHMGVPLAGMLYRWQHLEFAQSWVSGLCHALSLLTITLEVVLALALARRRLDPVLVLVALAGAALAVVGGQLLYEDRWSYARVFAWLPLGVWLACVQLRWRWALVVTALPVVLPLAVVAKAWLYPA
jgi:hypothetical protein